MAVFSIHAREEGLNDARFLRDGFSFSAFLLGPLWLLGHGLYFAVLFWAVAVLILIATAGTLISSGAAVTIFGLVQILVGLEADNLLQAKLSRQGYRLVDIVATPTLDEAEVMFYRGRAPRDAESSPGGDPIPEARL